MDKRHFSNPVNPLVLLISIASAFLLLTAGTIAAAPKEEITVLEKVVVSDQKPAAGNLTKTEIKAEQISSRQAQVQDTAKLLDDIPGVSFQQGGGVSSLPIIHGLNDDRVKMDVNGMTITSACANHMNPPLSYIDRTNVGKITVLQGVTPVSAGGDSIGGTIIVQSPEPVFAENGKDLLINGKASAFYRSNGDAFGGSIAAGIANQHARLDYTGSHSESMNYNDGNGQIIKSTAYENQNHAASLAFKFDNHLLEFKGGQQHIPFQGFPNQRMDLTNNDSIFGNVRYKGNFDWGNLESKLYLENTSHSMNFGEDKFLGKNPYNAMPMETRGRNFGYKVQAEIPLNSRDTVRVGNEFVASTINDFWPPVVPSSGPSSLGSMMWPNTFINLNNATRDRVGTFAEWEASWSSKWKSGLGLRYDHTMTDTGNVATYNGDANAIKGLPNTNQNAITRTFNGLDHARNYDTFDITGNLQFTPDSVSQFELGYARKNRAPSLYELYPWNQTGMMMTMIGTYGDGNGYMGNMNLKPETAHNISLSAEFHDAVDNSWRFKATPYFSYVENYIDADRCTSTTYNANKYAYDVTGCMNQPDRAGGPLYGEPDSSVFHYLRTANHDARLWGFDASGETNLYHDRNLGDFDAKTSMSYVRGERMDGGNLYHMMPFNIKLGLGHKLQGWKNQLEMQFVDSKTDVQQIRSELTTPAYILLNAKTGYTWKNLSIDIGLDNILDKQYFHPLAGAYTGNYYAMNLAAADPNKNLPGMGRSVFVGMSLSY